jgi:hypothetical protein
VNSEETAVTFQVKLFQNRAQLSKVATIFSPQWGIISPSIVVQLAFITHYI